MSLPLGYPSPRQGVTQSWLGATPGQATPPHPRPWSGVPLFRTGLGHPPLGQDRTGLGYPPEIAQQSEYAAGSMSLAIVQEDFLVFHLFSELMPLLTLQLKCLYKIEFLQIFLQLLRAYFAQGPWVQSLPFCVFYSMLFKEKYLLLPLSCVHP